MCRWYSPGFVRLCYRKGTRRGQRVAMDRAAWEARTTRCYGVASLPAGPVGHGAALAFRVGLCHPAEIEEMRRSAGADVAERDGQVVTLAWKRRRRIDAATIVARAASFGWRPAPGRVEEWSDR